MMSQSSFPYTGEKAQLEKGNTESEIVKGLTAGEMAQQLTLTVLLEVLSSIPSNCMMAHNHL